MARFLVAPLALVSMMAGPLLAQGDPESREKLKREVLEAVEKIIQREEGRLLKAIDELLKEEFSKLKDSGQDEAPAKPRGGRGYLGIRPVEMSEDERQERELAEDEGAIRIGEVLPDTPAETAGFLADDVIVRIDGKKFATREEFVSALTSHQAGDKVDFQVLRDGKPKDLTATLGRVPGETPAPEEKPEAKKEEPKKEAPSKDNETLRDRARKFLEEEGGGEGGGVPSLDDLLERFGGKDLGKQLEELMKQLEGQAPDLQERFKDLTRGIQEYLENLGKPAPEEKKARPYLGVFLEELTEEEAKEADLPEGVGLLVVEVTQGSSAAKAGLEEGDILLAIGGEKVRGHDTIREFMKGASVGDDVKMVVLRKGKEKELSGVLGARKE